MKKLVIDRRRIAANAALIKKRAENQAIYAVLKGNAYGLGLLEMAKVLKEEGIHRFAVTEPEDGVLLRRSGLLEEEILVLRSSRDERFVELLLEHNLVGTIGSNEAALVMNGLAERHHGVLECHVEIDTGMGRQGFSVTEADKVISVYRYLQNLALTGIYTHFYRAYDSEKTTRGQVSAFSGVIKKLTSEGIDPGLIHACNSSALFRYDLPELGAVRVGSAFTGRCAGRQNFGLLPVGQIHAACDEVRWLKRGDSVGYGGCFKAKRPTRAAIFPVGYADGFCTEKSRDSYRPGETLMMMLSALKRGLLRKKLYIYINGKPARVIGHVGMCHTVADVTNMPCEPGDLAVFPVNPILSGIIEREYV